MTEQPNPRPTQDAISNTLVLVLTYDSPITEDTVAALVDVHQGDEGMVKVTGGLLR